MTIDDLEVIGGIPIQITDFMREHGHFPKHFSHYKISHLDIGTITVFLMTSKHWLYYFTYSEQDDPGVTWDVFHPNEVNKLRHLLILSNA